MMKQTIKQTFVAPDAVFLTTDEDGTCYVTDRFIAWRLDALPIKAHAALTYLTDGCYAISSTGATSPAKGQWAGAQPPRGDAIARIIGSDARESVDRTSLTVDSGKWGTRVYVSESGTLAGVNGLLDFTGFDLRTTETGKKYAITKSGEVVGVVMHVRIEDQLAELRGLFPVAVSAVA